MHIIRLEDTLANPYKTLSVFCKKLGVAPSESLKTPTFNREPLPEVYPWGTIRRASTEANRTTALELSKDEIKEIQLRAWQYLTIFNYEKLLK